METTNTAAVQVSESTAKAKAAYDAWRAAKDAIEAAVFQLKGIEGEDYINEHRLDFLLDTISHEVDQLVTQSIFEHLEAGDGTI